jgi:hypothetical protein
MIHYRFIMKNGTTHSFEVDRSKIFGLAEDSAPHASWALLSFKRCKNCSLPTDLLMHCPAAVAIEQIADRFQAIRSFEEVRMEVETTERTCIKECDVQTGLRSLLGLVLATSGCPILSQFKGLAAFHLPFSSIEETLFRTVGAHLLKQYFIYKQGGKPDWELRGLDAFYQDLHIVNTSLNDRLTSACTHDANLNAIVSLNYLSLGVTYSIEENLSELKDLFCPR